MTIHGLYSTLFKANNNEVGAGIVVIDGASLHGGNSSYFYKGKYRLDDKNISATVEVQHYAGPPNSVLGPMIAFRLKLQGVAAPLGFILSGALEAQPRQMIQIDLIKISDLVTE